MTQPTPFYDSSDETAPQQPSPKGHKATARFSPARRRTLARLRSLLKRGLLSGGALSGLAVTGCIVVDPLPHPPNCDADPTTADYESIWFTSARWEEVEGELLLRVRSDISPFPEDTPVRYAGDATIQGAEVVVPPDDSLRREYLLRVREAATTVSFVMPVECETTQDALRFSFTIQPDRQAGDYAKLQFDD